MGRGGATPWAERGKGCGAAGAGHGTGNRTRHRAWHSTAPHLTSLHCTALGTAPHRARHGLPGLTPGPSPERGLNKRVRQ